MHGDASRNNNGEIQPWDRQKSLSPVRKGTKDLDAKFSRKKNSKIEDGDFGPRIANRGVQVDFIAGNGLSAGKEGALLDASMFMCKACGYNGGIPWDEIRGKMSNKDGSEFQHSKTIAIGTSDDITTAETEIQTNTSNVRPTSIEVQAVPNTKDRSAQTFGLMAGGEWLTPDDEEFGSVPNSRKLSDLQKKYDELFSKYKQERSLRIELGTKNLASTVGLLTEGMKEHLKLLVSAPLVSVQFGVNDDSNLLIKEKFPIEKIEDAVKKEIVPHFQSVLSVEMRKVDAQDPDNAGVKEQYVKNLLSRNKIKEESIKIEEHVKTMCTEMVSHITTKVEKLVPVAKIKVLDL